jgi:CheY-like chemotaxis protein
MTAKAQPHEVKEYLSLGAAGVVNKPFDPMTLSDVIRDIWARIH